MPAALDGRRASIDTIVESARRRYPAEVVRFVFVDDDELRAKVVMAPADSPDRSRDHRVEFDMRSAAMVADAPAPGPRPGTAMAWISRLHTELAAGPGGAWVLAAVGAVFALSVISGVAIYGPYLRKLDFGAVRHCTRRVRWLDLHNLLGISIAVWALVVALTGVLNELSKPLSAHWRRTGMSEMLQAWKGQPPVLSPGSAEAAMRTVQAALPGRNVTSVIFPSQSFSNPHHFLIWTNGNTPLTHRLFTAALVDARTGALTAVAPMPAYLRALQLARPLHFGDYGGLPLKILWALLDLIAIVVLGSGAYLSLGRLRGTSGNAGAARSRPTRRAR